jgi:hypothetical protein
MPFGLTNAPSTFQSLMNYFSKLLLRKNLLVFFDDILIYKKSWEEHTQHIDRVLKLLEEQQIYENDSKFSFGFKKWNIWVILYLMVV